MCIHYFKIKICISQSNQPKTTIILIPLVQNYLVDINETIHSNLFSTFTLRI